MSKLAYLQIHLVKWKISSLLRFSKEKFWSAHNELKLIKTFKISQSCISLVVEFKIFENSLIQAHIWRYVHAHKIIIHSCTSFLWQNHLLAINRAKTNWDNFILIDNSLFKWRERWYRYDIIGNIFCSVEIMRRSNCSAPIPPPAPPMKSLFWGFPRSPYHFIFPLPRPI